jgi:periplasmic divalent cation tolerance protein
VRLARGSVRDRRCVGEREIGGLRASAPIASVYEWKSVVEHDDEVLLTVITRVGRFEAIVDLVRSMHSYELPAITSVAVSGTAEYLAWVHAQTT